MIRDVPKHVTGLPRRNALIAGGTLVALVAGATVVVANSRGPELTLVSEVTEGSVSTMITAKGVAAAAKTANLSFKTNNTIKTIDVKVGDKVKKGQKLGELDNTSLKQALLTAQGTLVQQQAALDLILNDVNPQGLQAIANRAKDVADQAKNNIDIRYKADKKVYERQNTTLKYDKAAIQAAKSNLDTNGCTRNGSTEPQQFPAPAPNVVPVPGPGVQSPTPFGVPTRPTFPNDPDQATAPQNSCRAAYNTYRLAQQKEFNDRSTFINSRENQKVNRGVLRSTYRTALQALATAQNTANIARVNRPNQILAQKALVANAQAGVLAAQSGLKNSFIYAPSDGTVTAIDGAVGEYTAGGNNLTPQTPLAPGTTARIPSVGQLASNDQKNPTNTNATNLSAVNPAGGAFMQLSDLNTFQVVAAYPEADAAKITPGSLAKVTFDAFPAAGYDGTVTSVSPTPVSGPGGASLYYATVLLNQAPPELKSGMAANLSVVVATVQNKAYVVPSNAVQTSGDETYVMIPGENGVPEKKVFTRGSVGDDNSQVMDGLKPGDKVLVPSTGPLPTSDDDAPDAPLGNQPVPVIYNPPAQAQPAPQAAAAPAAAPAAGMDPSMANDPALMGDPMLDGPDPLAGDGGMGSPAQGGQIMAPSGSANAGQAGVNPFAPQPAPAAGN
jgi:HlyD family secretion protein